MIFSIFKGLKNVKSEKKIGNGDTCLVIAWRSTRVHRMRRHRCWSSVLQGITKRDFHCLRKAWHHLKRVCLKDTMKVRDKQHEHVKQREWQALVRSVHVAKDLRKKLRVYVHGLGKKW